MKPGSKGTERRVYDLASSVAKLRITVIEGPDRGKSFEQEGAEQISLGVSPDNTVVLSDPAISRYHLELDRDPAGIRIADLGSLNGTFIGGLKIERAVVPPKTRLSIGDTILQLEEGGDRGSPEAEEVPLVPGLVGHSPAFQQAMLKIARLAPASFTILIQGETGTGKEQFAKALHALGPRNGRPFEVVDCGSMPATLIASELFGHERGAFTGAERRQIGAFERANGGTILLDEIGELPINLQPTLLGVLERRRFRRLGGDAEIDLDLRVLSATHRDLRAEVNQGNFRADLYFRLAVARLVIPPLRERTEDIPDLVDCFVRETTGEPSSSYFSAASLESLKGQRWSGNVRELRNFVESSLALGDLAQDPAHAPPAGQAASGPRVFRPYREARGAVIEEFERSYLTELMQSCGGNASEAARRAKMDRPYLLTRLRKYDLR